MRDTEVEAMRAMWKGAVSFGLVTIPIQLYAATENKNVSLRQVHESDGGRIQYKRFCSIEGKEVPYAEIAKGYELDDGEMVVLTDEDLADLPLATSRTIDVVEFVPLESVDPIQFDRTYYLEPQKAAATPYVLLRDALHKSGQVAVAKVALRQRESLALLRVHGDVLVMTTMLWPDEVRRPDFAFLDEDPPQVRPQELTMAATLIDSLSEPVFEPEKFTDHYREALETLIEEKTRSGSVVRTAPPGTEGKAEVVDLMAALQASVSEAKKSRKDSTAARKGSTAKSTGSATRSAEKSGEKSGGRKAPAKKTSTGSRSRRSPKSA
jgi:DNA end-binding protein Ku